MPQTQSPLIDVMSLAAAIGPGKERSRSPGPEENQMAWALCAQALRRDDMPELRATLDKINFFPRGEKEGLLWLAACGDGASGFAELTQKFMEQEPGADHWRETVGERLRRQAYVSPYDAGRSEKRFRDSIHPQGAHGEGPVASALAADSPAALATLLSRSEWREALLAAEPKPLTLNASMSEKDILKAGQNEGSAFESSLLSEAMRLKAFGCVRLLLAIPEFCENIHAGRVPSLRHLEYSSRHKQTFFEEDERVQFSFFETLLGCGSDLSTYGEDSARGRWEAAIDQAIESANASVIEPQGGTGMMWAQILCVQSHPMDEKSEARLMRRLELLEERGHDVDWQSVAHVAASYRSPVIREWSALRAASEREEPMARRKPALSL